MPECQIGHSGTAFNCADANPICKGWCQRFLTCVEAVAGQCLFKAVPNMTATRKIPAMANRATADHHSLDLATDHKPERRPDTRHASMQCRCPSMLVKKIQQLQINMMMAYVEYIHMTGHDTS